MDTVKAFLIWAAVNQGIGFAIGWLLLKRPDIATAALNKAWTWIKSKAGF